MGAILGLGPLGEHLEHADDVRGDLPRVFERQGTVRALLPETPGLFEKLLPGLAHPKVEITPDNAFASSASTLHLGIGADGERSVG